MSSTTPTKGLASAEWLAQNLGRDDIVVLDSTTNIVADANGQERVVAEREAFEREHIPGAQFVDLQAELSDPNSSYNFMLPDAAAFERALQRFGVNQDDTVIVYSSGNPWWATRIWWMFRHFGLDNAYVLDGGLKYWKQLNLPLESGAGQARSQGTIRVAGVRNLAIDGDTLKARLGEANLRLVNALPPDKFSGRSRVHGGRPGHIPGSVNVPAASLLDPETGRFKDRDALVRILDEAGLLRTGTEVVAYCGGGISASQVVFALHQSGHENVKLYDASLSEWAHRDDFPLKVTEPLDE